ncbi:MAG: glycosyltransferase family 4 protein [Elusimicrobia bacterium]|nr:glycosyltransferase family 4 protein [Elusimicrobiota bacterium]
MKPHVFLMTPCPPYPLDGGCKRVHTLCRLLRDRFRFSLATFLPKDAALDARHIAEELHREHLYLRPVFEKIHWLPRPEGFAARRFEGVPLPEDVARFFCPETAEQVEELVEQERPDLVHAEFDLTALYARRLAGMPKIWTQHDAGSIAFFGSYFREMHGWRKFLQVGEWRRRVAFVRQAGTWFDRVVVMTETDRTRLSRVIPAAKIRAISTGVETAHFAPGQGTRDETAPSIVYVGHYPHYPNEDAVVFFCRKVWPAIHKARPDARFFAVGSSPTPAVRRLESDLPGITVTGTVDDVKPYLQRATVFVAPIRLGEGIKGKILEALAMGLPVVATTRSLRGLQLTPGREVLAADTAAEFAAQCLRLLGSPALREELGQRGLELVRGRYEWSKLAPRVGDLYDEVLARAPMETSYVL